MNPVYKSINGIHKKGNCAMKMEISPLVPKIPHHGHFGVVFRDSVTPRSLPGLDLDHSMDL